VNDSLLIDQRQRWEQGDRILVETYLRDQPGLGSETDHVLELIEHELVLREERGETPQLEEYVRRFPDLARDLQLHFEVHAALQTETMQAPADLEANGSAAGRAPALAGYEVLGELGRGGMGVVYKARQVALNRQVALKMILAGPHANAAGVARFRREAEAVAQLQHPHIVQIYEVGESDGRPYLALEYVDGASLDHHTGHLPQPAEAAARLVEALASTMHYAHQRGVVHRDLKPANVLLVPSDSAHGIPLGNGPANIGYYDPKITDFGLAKLLGTDMAGPTLSGEILGTPSYMAPEQAEGKTAAIGPATDIWALGTILYELLTGRPPFQAESALETLVQVRSQEPVSPSRLQPKLPRDLVTICLACLPKEPRKRYVSAEALADDLRRFLDGKPIRARPINAVERTVKWVRRRPAIAALLATIVVVAALGFAGVVWQLRQTEDALKKAQEAEKTTKRHLYMRQIAQAQHEVRANHLRRAELLLKETDLDARGWEYEYLMQQCQTNLFVLRGNGSPVQAVAYSPDGRLLASGSGEWGSGEGGAVTVWDAQDGQSLWTHDLGTVYGVAFHPDGQRLASACHDGKVRLHDARTGQPLHELVGHSDRVYCVAFSPDGRHLASASRDETVRLWDVQTGTPDRTFSNHNAEVFSVAFSPNGLRLVSGDGTGIAHLWDRGSGTVLHSFGCFRDCRAVAFSPDGSWLALGYYRGQIAILDLKRMDAAPLVHHPNAGPILSLVFTPDGSLAWSSKRGTIKIQDLRTGADRYVFRGHADWAFAVAVRPDGRRLATAGRDGTVRIHDVTASEARPVYVGYPVQIPGLMPDPFDPEHRRFLALGRGQTWMRERNELHVWGVVAHKPLTEEWSLPARDYPSAMAGSPDGRFLAWVENANKQCRLRVRERAGQADVWSQELDAGPVTGLTYSPDRQLLAWGGADGMIRLCDAATGRQVRTLGPHGEGSAVTGVSFHPKDDLLATAGEDGTFCIWNFTSGKVVNQFRPSAQKEDLAADPNPRLDRKTNIIRIAFSPDGRRLAAANPRWPLEIWDVEAGRVVLILALDQEFNEGCSSAAWSADGRRLAAAFGLFVKIWDTTERSPQEQRQKTEEGAPAWHQREDHSAEERSDWFAAAYHVGKLIDAEPLRGDLYARRGVFRAYLAEAGRGRWEDAGADFAKAAELSRGWQVWSSQHALVTLTSGERDRYRQICTAMLARFGQIEEPELANIVARTCCLAPDAVADRAGVVALARRAQAQKPANLDYLNTLGAALYRAGDFTGAQQCLAETAKARRAKGNVWDWLFLAMTHHQLGQPNEAQRWLDKAVQALDQTAADRPPPGAGTLLPWYDRLELELLRREATMLLHPE
jgi:WD40 repeat protein